MFSNQKIYYLEASTSDLKDLVRIEDDYNRFSLNYKYKVLIPTAGIGSRLSYETRHINKSLVLINNKPIISYIIEISNQYRIYNCLGV